MPGVSAGDAYLDVHSRLAADFGRRLSAQVQTPAGRAGQEASRHFGRKFAAGLAVGGAVIGAGLYKATKLAARGIATAVERASDLNETLSKSEHIFGRNARAIQQWSRGSVSAMGLTRNEAIGNAAAFGDMFRQLGLGLNPATKMSKRMVELSADLASFSNADISDVLNAQQSAFRGEYDALQRFIPNINAARVQQEALRLTHKRSAKDLTAAEKAQATYAIMLRDSSRAQGDFARTAGEQANQQRIAKARLEEISTTVGKFFLPGVLAGTRAVNSFLLPTLQELAERHGPRVEKVFTRIGKTFARSLQGVDLERFASQGVAKLEQVGPKVADALDRIGKRLGEARKQVRPAAPEVSRLATALNLGGAALDFIGGHMDLVVKALPVLVAGFVAYKVAQAAGNIAAVASLPIQAAQVVANFLLARAVKAHALATKEATGATLLGTAIQKGATGATQVGTLALLRQRAATVATAVASKAAAAAALVWRGAQIALNFALIANPIGLVIAAVALLVAGIVLAYKHSETFRKIVSKVWDAVRGKVATVVNFILGLIRGWLNVQIGVVQGILRVMGKLPGPMGAPFRKAEEAVTKAKETINRQLDKIQARVNKLRGKDIDITAKFGWQGLQVFRTPGGALAMAGGGRVTVGTTPTADDVLARLSKGETIVSARDSARPEFQAWARERGIPGFQRGGVPASGTTRSTQVLARRFDQFEGQIEQVLDLAEARFKRLAGKMAVPGTSGSVNRVAQWTAAVLGRAGEWAAWARRIMFESGGNWSAVNRWDSNWLAGHPSVGGAQVIRGTFAAYAGRFRGVGPFLYGVSINPYANSYAGANYAVRRYGSLQAVDPRVRPRGYDQGGLLPPGLSLAYNGTGRPEPVGQHLDERRLAKLLADELRANPPVVELDGHRLSPLIRKGQRSLNYRDGR
jgi:hypothetical protein